MNGLALCAGIGALELGIKRRLGKRYRTVGYVEREAYAAAVLVARMEASALDRAPVWSDLETFNGKPWRGAVDLISSGIPCQPYSVAGKRKGNRDARALWPEFCRVVREVEPGALFLENVPPFLGHFGRAWAELRRLGFRFAPPLLHTASEVGAPHIRRRLFIYAAHPDRARQQGTAVGALRDIARGVAAAKRIRVAPPVSDVGGREEQRSGWVLTPQQTFRHDANGCDHGCRVCGSAWAVESPVCRMVDGPSDRLDRLYVLGNAVVPEVASRALALLMRCELD